MNKSTDATSASERTELFTIGSKQAFEIASSKLVHPVKETKGKCICIIAGRDSSDRATQLFIPNPPRDFIENWNTSKYRHSAVVATEINNESDIPRIFSKVKNIFTFRVERQVLVSEIMLVEDDLAMKKETPDRERIAGTSRIPKLTRMPS